MDQSNLKEDLAKIDSFIAERRICIRQGEALKRLKKNPDFINVILEGYIEAEATRLFKILTDPSGASPYSPEQIQLKLAAISHFKEYIGIDTFKGIVEIEAERAPLDIIREEDERKRITAEFAESGEN